MTLWRNTRYGPYLSHAGIAPCTELVRRKKEAARIPSRTRAALNP